MVKPKRYLFPWARSTEHIVAPTGSRCLQQWIDIEATHWFRLIYPWFINHHQPSSINYIYVYIYILYHLPFPSMFPVSSLVVISKQLFQNGKADVVIQPIVQSLVQKELQQRLESCRSTRRRWRWRHGDHVAHETFHEFPEAQAFLWDGCNGEKKTWELKVRLSWETILQLDRTWIFYDTTGVCWLVETTVMNFGKQHWHDNLKPPTDIKPHD